MRQTAIFCFAMAITGCASEPVDQDSSNPELRLRYADVRDAKKIVVTAGDSSSVIRSWHEYRCVFQQDGRCFCETTSYQEYASRQAERSTRITHEFPPETFREIRKLLLESKFLSLKPGTQQGIIFEGSRSVSVEVGARRFGITWGQGDCVEGQSLCKYIEKLREPANEKK